MVISLSVSESPVTDVATHTLYLSSSAIYLLPLRRVLQINGQIKESVILLHHLEPRQCEVLLRVKHVAVNFKRDFSSKHEIVPGSAFICKLATKSALVDNGRVFSLSDKVLVFPHSACWIQSPDDCCENCRILKQNGSLNSYHSHKQYPCRRSWVYGETIDGGLQDYIKVLQPVHSLIRVPSTVSLHDCCFLMDKALPFFVFCKEVLLHAIAREPSASILIVLPDSNLYANDCLLVIQHLKMESLSITFTDPIKMKSSESLARSYKNKFNHVCVFAQGLDAIKFAFELSISTGLESAKALHTVGLFGDNCNVKLPYFQDKTIHRVRLSYKDKFLMEELLQALNNYNRSDSQDFGSPARSESISSHESCQETPAESGATADPVAAKKLRFKKEPQVAPPLRQSTKRNILWLHCDSDYRLCLDEAEIEPENASKCQTTNDLNRILRSNDKPARVFYTNKSTSHEKLNAFIFTS